MEALVYNDERHEYRLDGRVVPSVTQILSRLSADEYRLADREAMERAAHLGKAVHRVIELDVRGTLDVESLSDGLVPYYEAWREFRALSGFEMLASEERVYSRRYGYAGTLDLFGILNGDAALIDAKRTATVPRTAGPQTAAYEIALAECAPDLVDSAASGVGRGLIQRFALHLTPGNDRGRAKWRLVPFTSKNDARVFLSAHTLHIWSLAA